jgi:ABC-type Mn2+/Zn2+ transport system ATPase subunit
MKLSASRTAAAAQRPRPNTLGDAWHEFATEAPQFHENHILTGTLAFRIFLARALLQDAQLTILDESFAALDPETLQKCLNCAQRRAKTLMVIAHP